MFEELENTLNEIKEQLNNHGILLQMALSSLTSSKQVAKFLGVSPRTIQLWVKNGKLQEGKHFYRDGKRLVFIPMAVMDLKNNPAQIVSQENIKKTIPHKTINPTAKKIISGLKKVSHG